MANRKSARHSFIVISDAGICGADGKDTSCSFGFSRKRIVAPKDLCVTTFIMAALERSREILGWTDAKAAKNDFAKARKYLDAMEEEIETK